jgi:plasmid stability protein
VWGRVSDPSRPSKAPQGCGHAQKSGLAFSASNDSIDSMATLTIRQLDEKTKTRLRVRAAHHGRSMEEEAREILRSALTAASPAKGNLAETVRRRFAALGGHELELPRRDPMRRAAEFGE